ncbi:MAG TPA: hypothetical protein VKZ81_06400 [Pseudonocardia sp.]|uniref:hypothetical protein n=1 Tax=Pseudonocardia sp. TaxID=60912 RepID=UPI002B4B1E3A|nr:hypothetical protein [Pseudonocardia sp.]HLU55074.1 hypothetical protein [Pseudonocardia sp.]
MGDAIPDRAIVAILRPFVRATRPVLDGLRESDPFGLRNRVTARDDGTLDERGLRDKILDALAAVEVPGTAAWAAMDTPARTRWWVRRVGRFTTVVAAVPGLGGALAKRLPVSSAVGAAAQGLLLVAIAGEHGVRDEDELVNLLGAVLFRRELAVAAATRAEDAEADARAAEITGGLGEPSTTPTLRRVAGVVWRLGRALLAVEDELDKRPHGNILHEGLSMLPVVGAAGKYLGEWSGLKKAARSAEKRLAERAG